MKLGPVTKLDKRNTATSKKLDDDFMLVNGDVIVISPVYGQFVAIWEQNSRHMVCKTYIFIKSSLLFYKNLSKNRSKNSLTRLSYPCFQRSN